MIPFIFFVGLFVVAFTIVMPLILFFIWLVDPDYFWKIVEPICDRLIESRCDHEPHGIETKFGFVLWCSKCRKALNMLDYDFEDVTWRHE